MEDDAGMYGEFGQALEPMASGSKRKRTLEWAMRVPEADVRLVVDAHQDAAANDDEQKDDDERDGQDRHTPKRSRPSPSPKQEPRSIRRKGARYGLSSLNKRHAEVEVAADNIRPSRFQEGSMSDKPSAQPPSVFTRDHSNPSLPALANVDHLMSRYHDENDHADSQDDQIEALPPPRPRQSASIHTATSAPASASVSASISHKPSGLFRFGKMFTSSFSPFNVWESFSKTWKESKEDLTVRNIEENRRRQQSVQADLPAVLDDRAMYEQAYQELKKSGQFNFTVVSNKALTSPRIGGNSQLNSPSRQPLTSPRHTPYAHLRSNVDYPHSRDTSLDSTNDAAPPPQLAALFKRDDTLAPPDIPQSPEKPLKTRKSFFTLRGASLRAPSLSSLKRGRSTNNLGDAFVRTPASVSPEKPTNHLTLQSLPRSQSKRDLNRQAKLGKRVSDLETKLADARRELNDAITNASPLPPLPSRFEKFTPTSKSKFTRARFGLSSSKLPSLPSERLLSPENLAQDTPSLVRPRPKHTQSFDLTHLRDTAYPRDSAVVIDTPRSEIQSFLPVDYYNHQAPMDPATLASSDALDQSESEARPSLDARLKALDASIKSKNKKSIPSKKRKSTSKDEQAYKPPADDEEEDELEFVKEKPKKKRKSTGKKAATVEPANEAPGSEVGQGRLNKTNTKQQDTSKQPADGPELEEDRPNTGRSSMETLDPIDEEDVIVLARRVTSRTSSQHDSAISKADAESTHVRADSLKSILVNKHDSMRPSSRSSSKRPSSSHRRSSPPPPPAVVYPKLTPAAVEKDHVITATPGVGSVPAMPFAGLKNDQQADAGAKEQWDWPEDIF